MIEGLRALTATGQGPVFVVDAGNLYFKSPVLPEAQRPQAELRAELQAEAFALAGIDAMLPGAGDLAMGMETVQRLAARHGLPYVAANLECGGAKPFPASRVVERGGTRAGFIGIVGPTTKVEGCTVTDPAAAVAAALDGLRADVTVVLSGQKLAADGELPVSLVVNGQERRQYASPEPLANGGLLLASGSRMKQVGVLHFALSPGATAWRDDGTRVRLAEERDRHAARRADAEKKLAAAADDKARDRAARQVEFYGREVAKAEEALARAVAIDGAAHAARNRLVDLGTDIADHAATAALVAKAKAAIEAAEPARAATAILDGPFVGSAACAACHPAETTQWATTRHATAYASLVNVQRSKDDQCFSCHVTGALHPDGPRRPGAVLGLENVGCEACHGPGKAHAESPATVDLVAKPDESTCTGCHDGVRDSDKEGARFDLATYLPRVVHP